MHFVKLLHLIYHILKVRGKKKHFNTTKKHLHLDIKYLQLCVSHLGHTGTGAASQINYILSEIFNLLGCLMLNKLTDLLAVKCQLFRGSSDGWSEGCPQ